MGSEENVLVDVGIHIVPSKICPLKAIQEPLVALDPRRPPRTNVGTETAFRHDHRKHFQKSKRLLRSEVS